MDNKCEEILEVSHVTNRYRDSGSGFLSRSKMTRVLNDVSLTIHRDEIFGLVGESGCGKSTLGRAVLGLIPFEGTIRVDGMEYYAKNRQEFTRSVQAVFQDPLSSLNPRRTIAATLEEPLLTHGIVPVFCPINHDGQGQLFNTNADTIAGSLAAALCAGLVYCFEKKGVLKDKDDDNSVIPSLDAETYTKLRLEGVIDKGMVPKLDNAFGALQKGASRVVIKHALDLLEDTGTVLK